MPQAVTHAEAHAGWSAAQLKAFQKMTPQARLDAVKTGALEHWTPEDRDAALDLVANAPKFPETAVHSDRHQFEPVKTSLPSMAYRPSRFDPMIITAAMGWLLITLALAGHAYGFY